MNPWYIIFIILFAGVMTYFAFIDTKKGFRYALPLFLRIFVPLVLTGIIVKIPQLIGLTEKGDIVSYIIGAIGSIIFFIVLINVFRKAEKQKRLNVLDYFLGFIFGVLRGWLYFGYFTLYIHRIFDLKFIDSQLLNTIITPVEWVLFLSFF